MPWSELTFGKHEGKTLPQVVFADPDWFFWAFEEKVFKGALAPEADELHRKATRIRIPQSGPEELVAEYFIHPGVGKFGGFELVPKSQPQHEGASPAFRSPYIDLSVSRRIASYDKRGGKMLMDSVKFHLFGNPKTRMTRQRCEEFFDDAGNFVP